jgi:hypothetical protein
MHSVRLALVVALAVSIAVASVAGMDAGAVSRLADGAAGDGALHHAVDGACFVALAIGSTRLVWPMRWRPRWGRAAAAVGLAAGVAAATPVRWHASPWSLALFCACAAVGACP